MTTLYNPSYLAAIDLAYMRTFMNIPFSEEIFEAVKTLRNSTDAARLPHLKYPEMTAFFEATYLLTDRLLAQTRIHQVLELAAGLSPRGILKTMSPKVAYAEMDVSENIQMKNAVIEELEKSGKLHHRQNLLLVDGNPSTPNYIFKPFNRAAIDFQLKSIVVISEDLHYVSLSDKENTARNIWDMLCRFGGLWITSDIDQIQAFYDNLGFKIEAYPLLQMMDQLLCPARLHLSSEKVKDVLSKRSLFVMRLK